MKLLASLKARFPRLSTALVPVAILAGVGGLTAYEKLADDCCYPGASCCHPGAACCAKHHAKVAQR